MEKNNPKNHPDAGNMPSQNTDEDFDTITSDPGEMTKRKTYQKDNVLMDESDDEENENELMDDQDDDQNSNVEADEAAGEEFIDKDPNRKGPKEDSY